MHVFRTANAEYDLDTIAWYYGALNPAAALAMLDRIAEVEAILGRHPLLGRRGHVPGTREAVVDGTPFVLVYAVAAEALTVLRVIDARRDWPAEDRLIS